MYDSLTLCLTQQDHSNSMKRSLPGVRIVQCHQILLITLVSSNLFLPLLLSLWLSIVLHRSPKFYMTYNSGATPSKKESSKKTQEQHAGCECYILIYTVVSRKSAHGRSTLQACQRGGWTLFQVFLHLSTKECPCMLTVTHCPQIC